MIFSSMLMKCLQSQWHSGRLPLEHLLPWRGLSENHQPPTALHSSLAVSLASSVRSRRNILIRWLGSSVYKLVFLKNIFQDPLAGIIFHLQFLMHHQGLATFGSWAIIKLLVLNLPVGIIHYWIKTNKYVYMKQCVCCWKRNRRGRIFPTEAIWRRLRHTCQGSCSEVGDVGIEFTSSLCRGEKALVSGSGLVYASESLVSSNRQVPFSRWYLRPLGLR